MTGSTANRRRRPVALDFSANRPRPRRRRLVTAELFSPPCRSVTGRGNLVPDGYLAALAIEHAATRVTCDHAFTRFPGLRWQAPLPAEVSQPSSKRERSESSTVCSWTARRFAAWSASARRPRSGGRQCSNQRRFGKAASGSRAGAPLVEAPGAGAVQRRSRHPAPSARVAIADPPSGSPRCSTSCSLASAPTHRPGQIVWRRPPTFGAQRAGRRRAHTHGTPSYAGVTNCMSRSRA